MDANFLPCFLKLGLGFLQIAFRPSEFQIGAAGIAFDFGKHFFGCAFLVKNQLCQCGIGCHFLTPKVLRWNQQSLARVVRQLDIQRCAAQKRVIAQDALTEAVDGVNRGVVKLAQRGFEAENQAMAAFLSVLLA